MRNCPACRSANSREKFPEKIDYSRLDSFAYSSRKLPELMHRKLDECVECKTLFDPNYNSHKDLSLLYQSADFDSAEMAASAAKTYVSLLSRQKLISNKSILDIGTGDGIFLAEASLKGASEICGVEPSLLAIEAASENIKEKIIHGAIEDIDFGDKKFDLVTFFMTIEHVGQPEKVVEVVKAILRTNGHFAVIGHNRLSLINRILGRKSPIFDIEHIQIFTKSGLKKFMLSNGFKNIKITKIRNEYPIHYWIRLAPLPESFKKSRIVSNSKFFKIPLRINVGNILITGKI